MYRGLLNWVYGIFMLKFGYQIHRLFCLQLISAITYYDGTDLDVFGANRNSQQGTASTAVQLLYSDLDCLRSGSDAPARGFRPVVFWASKTEGGGADSTLPPPPPSVTPRYKSYGPNILRILRSFQFWVYLGKLWVFPGILSTFFRVYWYITTPPGRPCPVVLGDY